MLIFVMCVLIQLPEIYLLSSFPLLCSLEIKLFYSSEACVFNIVPLFFSRQNLSGDENPSGKFHSWLLFSMIT